MVSFITFLLYFFVFAAGAVVGSFLNVLVYRIPQGISFAKGRSFCPHCGEQLKPYDMVPVLSFLFLRGKCRNCREKISLRYPLVEAFTGAVAVLLFLWYDFSLQAVTACVLLFLLIPVFLIDLDTMTIPNGLVLALLVPALLACFAFAEVSLLSRVIGIAAVSLPMLLMTLLIRDCFGGGDIKLMAVCGFLLGWQGTLLAAFFAILAGGVWAVVLLARRKAGRKSHMAFGPFLTAGVFLSFVFGGDLIAWYLRIFRLA